MKNISKELKNENYENLTNYLSDLTLETLYKDFNVNEYLVFIVKLVHRGEIKKCKEIFSNDVIRSHKNFDIPLFLSYLPNEYDTSLQIAKSLTKGVNKYHLLDGLSNNWVYKGINTDRLDAILSQIIKEENNELEFKDYVKDFFTNNKKNNNNNNKTNSLFDYEKRFDKEIRVYSIEEIEKLMRGFLENNLLDRYIDLSNAIKKNIPIQDYEKIRTENFYLSCEKDNVDFVKFFIKDGENILKENQHGFLLACKEGSLNVVQFFLENNETKEIIDPTILHDWAIRNSCENGKLEVVKYLLENQNKINIHNLSDYAFKKALNNKHYDVIQYLLYDFNIEITKEIEDSSKEDIQVNAMVEKIILNKKLKQELQETSKIKKRNKI